MKFSIITPVFNRADCVARCIESVINQKQTGNSKLEYEHIIVNDGSKDDTDNIVKKYAEKVPNIIYINFKENKGTNAARNAAIKAATGDFCIILDSDDFFVENALETISATMLKKPGYKHYMFAPDDRKDYFDSNELLKKEQIITFRDFLSQKYSGDFIHVIKREIMQKYPFDESLRIYEGVFFLKFYREAQNICFTNIVVTIRERGREDSVTKEYIKTNKTAINNAIKALEIKLDWYKNDYLELGLINSINDIYKQLLVNYLLVGNYQRSMIIIKIAKKEKYHIPCLHRIIHTMRLGGIYRTIICELLKIKYNLIKTKVK